MGAHHRPRISPLAAGSAFAACRTFGLRLMSGLGKLLLMWCGALAAALLLAPAGARADTLDAALVERIRQFTLQAVQAQPVARPAAAPALFSVSSESATSSVKNVTTAAAPRVQVEVGAIDARLRLAPCVKAEPYLPNGTRLAGATRVGLRCVQGAVAWNISVPVHVQVLGRGLVALAALPLGAVLSAQDVAVGEVDLAADPSAALLDPKLLEGRTLARPLAVGQSIRQAHLKPRQWFAAGDTVKVVASGDGFAVAAQGQALTPGVEGQPARVRTEAGRVVSGMPVSEHQLALDL